MDTLQAAILIEILEVFEDEVVNRQNLGPNLFFNFIQFKWH